MKKFNEYFPIIATILLTLLLVSTCSNNKTTKSLVRQLKDVPTKQDMVTILEETTLWETLEVEEISDKEKKSVTLLRKLKERDEVTNTTK